MGKLSLPVPKITRLIRFKLGQIADALAYMHDKDIVHGDIKLVR